MNIIFTGNWLLDRMSRVLKPLGLSEPQFNVLSSVYEARGGAVCVGEIQAMMIQRSSNVTRIVDKLLARGLVTRSEHPENRRKVEIRITDEGIDLYRRARRAVRDINEPGNRGGGKSPAAPDARPAAEAPPGRGTKTGFGEAEARELSLLLDKLRGELNHE